MYLFLVGKYFQHSFVNVTHMKIFESCLNPKPESRRNNYWCATIHLQKKKYRLNAPGEVHLPGVDLEDVQPGLFIWRRELNLPKIVKKQ
jgi:hypothetical protein